MDIDTLCFYLFLAILPFALAKRFDTNRGAM